MFPQLVKFLIRLSHNSYPDLRLFAELRSIDDALILCGVFAQGPPVLADFTLAFSLLSWLPFLP